MTSVFRGGLRGIGASAGVAILAALLLAIGARWGMPQTVHGPVGEGAWTARSRAMFVATGFHRPEYDGPGDRHFSWTTDTSQLAFPRLSRSIAYRVRLRLRGGHPAGGQPPVLRITVDDRPVRSMNLTGGDREVEFEIPRRDQSGAVVALDVSPTFTPGNGDRRVLGVIVDDVAVSPVNGPFRVDAVVLLWAAVATFACAWAVWMTGLRGALFATAAAGVVAAFVWLLLKDAAFAGVFVERLLHIGLGASVIGLVVAAARARWPEPGGARDWSIAAGLVLAACVVKLAVYWHPLAMVGDAMFQVHRAQEVHAGQYFLTSVTPRPFYEFPYPVALFVAAQPFWDWFPGDFDLVRLLRLLSLGVDAMVGLALYALARRQWPDRPAVLYVAALWPFARAPFEALTNANLTNLFGQGLFGVALAGVAWMAAGSAISWPWLALIALLLALSFLSHFGTLIVGLAIVGAVVIVLAGLGRQHVRRMGVALCAVLLAATAVSWVVYYSNARFTDVYAKTFASVRSHERDDSSKLDAAPSVKLQRWWSGVGDDYGRPGIPVLVVALAGLVMVVRRRPRDGGALVMMAWLSAWLALSVLGVVTSITVRANLATAPVFIYLGGLCLADLATRSRLTAAAAVALFALLAWDGWQLALRCLDLAGAR